MTSNQDSTLQPWFPVNFLQSRLIICSVEVSKLKLKIFGSESPSVHSYFFFHSSITGPGRHRPQLGQYSNLDVGNCGLLNRAMIGRLLILAGCIPWVFDSGIQGQLSYPLCKLGLSQQKVGSNTKYTESQYQSDQKYIFFQIGLYFKIKLFMSERNFFVPNI